MSQTRPLRADAVRNRHRILEAARAQLSSHGPEVGMQDIARAAGVAVGTLYRHYPTKTDLVAAVIAEHVAEVADAAESSLQRAREGAPAAAEVRSFLDHVSQAMAHNHAAKAAARNLGMAAATPSHHPDEERAGAALAALLRIGQQDGQIRADVTVDDIYLLMGTTPSDQPAAVRRRWLDLLLQGILLGT